MAKEKKELEICVDRVESALAAERGGADRVELCGNLLIGGTTPEAEFFRIVKRRLQIPVHVMVRPRYGDFCYTEDEFSMLCAAIKEFKNLGADGIVCGILKPDGRLDVERMAELRSLSQGMRFTLHRAFDLCQDPFEALEQACRLGIDIILTSGQKQRAMDGMDILKTLEEQAKGRILLQAGASVSSENIPLLYEKTGIRAYHMSGKVLLDSPMLYRKKDVSMGIASMSEYEIMQTDEKLVREARAVLDRL